MPGATVGLAPRVPLAATVRLGEPIRLRVTAPAMATAPVTQGQRIGRVEVMQGDRVVGGAPLAADRAVAAPGFTDSVRTAFAGIGSVFT